MLNSTYFWACLNLIRLKGPGQGFPYGQGFRGDRRDQDVSIQSFHLPGAHPSHRWALRVRRGRSRPGGRFWRHAKPRSSGWSPDRRYFARPAKTLFAEVREHFALAEQVRVYMVIERHVERDRGVPRFPTGRRNAGRPTAQLSGKHSQGHPVPARAAAGDGLLPLAQAPRGGLRGGARVRGGGSRAAARLVQEAAAA